MSNAIPFVRHFSLPAILLAANALFVLCYIGLIAVVMSYAALQVEFAQSVRSDESAVALLESNYLQSISTLTTTDYATLGYQKPVTESFVVGAAQTALTVR